MIIGVDAGGTKIAAASVRHGRTAWVVTRPTEARRPARAVLETIAQTIEQAASGQSISAIGVGIAGIIDWRRGQVIRAANLGANFRRVKVAEYLSKRFHCPATLENDASVFALGEALHGAGRAYRNVVGITVGTGIGGGIIFNREIYHGKNNLAGEVGQMFLDRRRSLEQLANGAAFKRRGRSATARTLGIGLYNILTVLDPDCIVIGGGLSRVEGLVAAARQVAYQSVYYAGLKRTPILVSELKERAAILGAAELARRLIA